MMSNRSERGLRISLSIAAALMATAPAATALAGESDASASISSASDQTARRLQLGVGKSVIVDLPEEAGEIYVGDPKIANAIVRSARRVYVSGVANGQTSIFAFARDGRKIATIQVSVGRDVGELSSPAQRGHTGKRHPRAHGRRQDHPHRNSRVSRRGSEGARYRVRLRR